MSGEEFSIEKLLVMAYKLGYLRRTVTPMIKHYDREMAMRADGAVGLRRVIDEENRQADIRWEHYRQLIVEFSLICQALGFNGELIVNEIATREMEISSE